MSRVISTRYRFSRRSLLAGLGAGTALLGPFLRHRSALAAPASSGNLLIFFTPNGHKRAVTVNNVTKPAFDATGGPTSLTLGTAMTPLEPYKSDIAVIKGLNLKTPTFIASHQDNCRILTCWGAPKEGNDNSQFTGYGPSIDQSIGMAINQQERGGLSDGNLIWDMVPTLDGLGPWGDNDHCSERSEDGSKLPEFVEVSSFVPKAIVNVVAVSKLLLAY